MCCRIYSLLILVFSKSKNICILMQMITLMTRCSARMTRWCFVPNFHLKTSQRPRHVLPVFNSTFTILKEEMDSLIQGPEVLYKYTCKICGRPFRSVRILAFLKDYGRASCFPHPSYILQCLMAQLKEDAHIPRLFQF